MTRSALFRAGGVVLGIAVPYAVLLAAAAPAQQALGLAVAPFAWTHLVVVHLLAALPLSILLAATLAKRDVGRALFWIAVAVVTAAWTVISGSSVTPALDLGEAGFTARLLIRVLWCLALQLPWCLCGWGCGRTLTDGEESLPFWSWGWGFVVLLVAIALPAVHANDLVRVQSRKAGEWMHRQRLARARPLVAALSDLGSSTKLGGLSAQQLSRAIERDMQILTGSVSRPLPTSASPTVRIDRAHDLAVLGRVEDAERELQPLADTVPGAAVLLAALLQDQERWQDSNRWYRHALTLLCEGPRTLTARTRAYDGLAFNARQQHEDRVAEAVYHEALARIPQAQARFHFQLGRHHQLRGRPDQAIHHLRTAARLEPDNYGQQAGALIDELSAHTPGCLWRWAER